VDLRCLHHLAGLLFRYTAFEPLRLVERSLFDGALESAPLAEDPIFVLGHWRSGTSYLQTLLSRDPRHTTSTLFRSLFVDISRVSESWLQPLMNLTARVLRLPFSIQRMPLQLDIPAECDIGLCSWLSPHSYTWGHVFPRSFSERFERCVLGPSDDQDAGWLADYDRFFRKLSRAAGGRRVVAKSPGDSARIPQLLRRYPQARFVYIHRDPIAVFHSNRYLWGVIQREFALQRIASDAVDQQILDTYRALLQRYLSQRALVPPGQLVELRYASLRTEPVATLTGVYDGLGLGELPAEVLAFLDDQPGYRAPTYTTPPALEARIREAWAFAFEAWPPVEASTGA